MKRILLLLTVAAMMDGNNNGGERPRVPARNVTTPAPVVRHSSLP
jgi:hypothetical protein